MGHGKHHKTLTLRPGKGAEIGCPDGTVIKVEVIWANDKEARIAVIGADSFGIDKAERKTETIAVKGKRPRQRKTGRIDVAQR